MTAVCNTAQHQCVRTLSLHEGVQYQAVSGVQTSLYTLEYNLYWALLNRTARTAARDHNGSLAVAHAVLSKSIWYLLCSNLCKAVCQLQAPLKAIQAHCSKTPVTSRFWLHLMCIRFRPFLVHASRPWPRLVQEMLYQCGNILLCIIL